MPYTGRMENMFGNDRVFLFLQGPHGPFFSQLGRMLTRAGAKAWRVGFNAGDRFFWPRRKTYLPYRGTLEGWPEYLIDIIHEKSVTDIVLYGDTRPIHAEAIKRANARNIRVHVFEEGYMRPWWVTYERGGSNGNSQLMGLSIEDMQRALAASDADTPMPPSHWGDTRHHVFYGALYHWFVMFANRGYAGFTPHRDLPVGLEFKLYFKRLLAMPFTYLSRIMAAARIRRGGFPYHMVLLQLEHDSAFQKHAPFATMTDFLQLVIEGFAKGAPLHHHLVIKTHPLEDGRAPLARHLRHLIKQHNLEGRVHYIVGGKLAQLLQDCRTAVTVNSTAAQQVLWRGIPLKAFGTAVYSKPELTSNQPLHQFFAAPNTPDSDAYAAYRRYLLATSQLPGGFYSARGRRQLMRQVVDIMLAPHDPYAAMAKGGAAERQQLHLVQ